MRAGWLSVLGLVLIGLLPGDADAQPSRKKAIWGPVERHGVSQFPIYADLGVGIFQMSVSWDEIAASRPTEPRNPADPAYRWPPAVDRAVAEASRHGIQVCLTIAGTPRWANGGRDARWAPRRPRDYAAFVAAAARRYPAVRHWMIWGEPTKASNFQPLPVDRGRRLRGAERKGPRIYARMLDASYRALKRLSRRNVVIGGNSYTTGTVRPLRWIQALRLRGGRRPRMDLYGHNPFSYRRPVLSRPPLGGGLADFGDLDTLARWLDRHLRRPRAGRRKLKLFLAEYSLPTDHPNHEFNFYVTRATQARWIKVALRTARRWRRIYALAYLGLYDDPVRRDGDQVERGLLERDGTRKPAYEAFRRG